MKYNDIVKQVSQFYAWQPSTWPDPPKSYNDEFAKVLKTIFDDSLLAEIANVINTFMNIYFLCFILE